MIYKQFVGIDISKLTLDFFVFEEKHYKQFSNDQKGFQLLLKWTRKLDTNLALEDIFFCLENKGLYSLMLSVFLEENNCVYAMISPLEIKRSMGITRGKNDKIDARRIAEYAYQKRALIKSTRLLSKAILKLHPLLTLHDRLTRERGGIIPAGGSYSRLQIIDQDSGGHSDKKTEHVFDTSRKVCCLLWPYRFTKSQSAIRQYGYKHFARDQLFAIRIRVVLLFYRQN